MNRTAKRSLTSVFVGLAVIASPILAASPASADPDFLTAEQEEAIEANMLAQGIEPTTVANLIATLDDGHFIDSQSGNARATSTNVIDEGNQYTTVKIFPDGSRQTSSIEKPAPASGEIGPMAVSGCTRVVSGNAVDTWVGCSVTGSDGTANLNFEADHWTPSLTIAGPYPFAKITSIHSWGGSAFAGSISLTSFTTVRIQATNTLPALARLSVQISSAAGTYPSRLELRVPGSGGTHTSAMYTP